jgi:hypothetical protein
MNTANISIVMTFMVPIVSVIAYFCYLTATSWQETALKRDMVARGYTANEILEVISGARGVGNSLSNVPPAKPIKQPA